MVSNKLLPAKIILVLIILLSFGTVMGVIGYSLSLKKSPPVTVQPTPSSNNGIADWQTYKSEDYGFEIKYPANFKIERNILWSADSTMPESCPDCTISYRFKPINSTIVVNSGSWGAAEDDIEKWIDGKNEEITVSGLYAIKREGKVTQKYTKKFFLI